MSFKDIYSEVKKRKMEALNKGEVVKAVEKHGRILAVDGKFEKPKKVIQHMYAAEKRVIRPADVMKTNLNEFDVLLIGCPGSEIPSGAYPKIKDFVVQHGGWLLTTDWAIRSIVEYNFPGFIRWNEKRTDDVVVACQIMEPNHPFLDGLLGEITQSKWQKETVKGTKKEEFRWWLENRSFPIEVLNHQAVHVLIASWEIKNKWGEAPVFVYFDYGQAGGRVIHMISHTHLQKGGAKGKFASALILTNILDEKISAKMGIGKKPASEYTSDWESGQSSQSQDYVTPHYAQGAQPPLEDQWVAPPQQSAPQQSNFVTPQMGGGGGGMGLTGTSQIIEADVNSASFSFATKCEYCGYDFGEAIGKIFQCKECSALYHENCINIQVNEGVCKKCNRILLW